MKIVGGQHMGLPMHYGTAAQLMVASLDRELARLQEIRNLLSALISVTPDREEPGEATQPIRRGKKPGRGHPWRSTNFETAETSLPDRSPVKRKYARRQVQGPKSKVLSQEAEKAAGETPAPLSGKMSPAEARSWLATAPEPFSSESLQAGTGLDDTQARNLLCRLRMREQIERVAFNQWKRTASFVAQE